MNTRRLALLLLLFIFLAQTAWAELSFFAAGDVGASKRGQTKVARQMAREMSNRPVSFVLFLGDNFYGWGVKSITDKKWKERFEDMYDHGILNIPFYTALGNHDYAKDPEIQVKYSSVSDRWKMPARYYQFQMPVEDSITADFFVLDTEALLEENDRKQLEWLEEALRHSKASWKIVVGHHPMHSSGKHRKDTRISGMFSSLFQTSGVDIYLAGHEHHLEFIELPWGTSQIISGGGSSPRGIRHPHLYSRFAKKSLGFARLDLTANQLRVTFLNEKDEILFTADIPKEKNIPNTP